MDVDLGLLSRALGRDVTSYTIEPIDPRLRVHSVTGGVFRVRAEDLSLVIKVVRNGDNTDPDALWISGAEESHRNYWKREYLAYCSGLLDALPGELRAPRTLMCTEASPEECWLWLEDVAGRPGSTWVPDDYDSVAFDLATTQAAYPSGRSILPTDDWLSQHWLRGWVETIGHQIAALDDDERWQEPWQAPMAAHRDRVRRLWAQRADLLAIVESAPQTVVHLDFWPTNLIAADDGTTVAVDWSQVGIGSISQDLDQLTLDPVYMLVLPDAEPAELETHVLPGYLSGLRSAGLDLDPDDVRRWYAAAAAVHYAPLAAYHATSAGDDAVRAAAEGRWGRPYADIVRCKARVVAHALALGESALDGR